MTINSTTYTQTGGATQNDGSLVMSPSSGTVQIQGGVFQGTGSVTGKVAVSGSGTRLTPGDSIGTLTISGSVTFGGSSGLSEELGAVGSPGTSDKLAITGNLDLSSATDQLDLSGGSAGGFYTIVTYSGTLTGIFNNVTTGYTIDYGTAHEIRVTGVPEPATTTGGLALLSITLLARRRSLPMQAR